jgi:HK97 family phage major capsid protein
MPKTIEELRTEQKERQERMRELDSAYQGEFLDPESDDGKEFAECERSVLELDKTIRQVEQRQETLERLANGEDNREDGTSFERFNTRTKDAARDEDIYDVSTVRSIGSPARIAREMRDRAFRAIERCEPQHSGHDQDKQRGSAEKIVKAHKVEDNRVDRYLLATGSPHFRAAFWKWLENRGQTSSFNREESLAWEEARQAERALSLTGSAGGFAVPFELDTTIMLTSNGVANPIRQIARVRQITVDEWRGITSAGITFAYAAEATETTDNAPTLAQPTVSTERAQGWIPFSIEIGQDWSSLQSDLAEAMQDGKDTLEAGKFISGTGTNEPFGVLTGTTNTVAAATGLTLTLANVYSLKNALPVRYRNSASAAFIADDTIFDRVRQFDLSGTATPVWGAGDLAQGRPETLLGYPAHQASEMAETITNGTKILVFGDFSRYLVADRVGMTVDFIPHVFGANQRPTGQRGLYVYFRNGAKVLDANAFRALTGTT